MGKAKGRKRGIDIIGKEKYNENKRYIIRF